jgi:hypothetical protein
LIDGEHLVVFKLGNIENNNDFQNVRVNLSLGRRTLAEVHLHR